MGVTITTRTPARDEARTVRAACRDGRARTLSRLLGLLFVLAALPGCDAAFTPPPRPAELEKGSGSGGFRDVDSTGAPASSASASAPALADRRSATPARTRFVELLLAQPPVGDRQFLTQVIRREAGRRKCGFRVNGDDLEKPRTPAELAKEIRAVAGRDSGALILEPIDAPEVRAALHEAEAKGLPIILLDTALPTSSPGKVYPTLTYVGFEDAGKKVVAAVIEDARAQNLLGKSPILLLEDRNKDGYSGPRLESLTAALKASGEKFEVLIYEGTEPVVRELVAGHLNKHPQAGIIIADNDHGLAGAFQAFAQVWRATRRMVVRGGYAACDRRLNEMILKLTPSLADRGVEAYAHKAIDLAFDLMDGKPAPERVEIPIVFLRKAVATPPVLTPELRDAKGLMPDPPKPKS